MHRSTKTPRTPPERWIRDEQERAGDEQERTEDEQERYESPVPDDPPKKSQRTTSASKRSRRPHSVSASRPDSTDSLSRSRGRRQQVIHTEDDLRTPRQPPTRTAAVPAAPKRPSTATSSNRRAPPARTASPDSDDSSSERYRRYSNQKYYNWRSDDSDDEHMRHKGHMHNGKNCELCNVALNGFPKRRPLTIEQLSLKSKPSRPSSIVVRQRSISDGDPCDYVETFVTKRKEKRNKKLVA